MKLKQLALRSGRWEAAVAPDFGANLTKLAYDGFPILRSRTGGGASVKEPLCLWKSPAAAAQPDKRRKLLL